MKSFVIGSILLSSLFIGCQSSGGICCDVDGEEELIDPPRVDYVLTPVANIDFNETTNMLSCKNSYDRDENNQSIRGCDWNITNSAGSVQFASTDDINMSNIDLEHSTTDTFLVKLKVTDDERQTNQDEKNITVNFPY